MGLIDRLNQRARKLDIFDMKLAQGTAMFAALIIAKLLPEIMTISIWWFVGLFILCTMKPFHAFWIK
jgi:hypothetical protein